MAIFNSYVSHYQRVWPLMTCFVHGHWSLVMHWLDVIFWSSKQEIESWLDDEEHLFWKQPQSVQTSESWYRWLWNISNVLNWCWKRILDLDFRETMKINIKHHQTSSNIIKHHQTSSNIIKPRFDYPRPQILVLVLECFGFSTSGKPRWSPWSHRPDSK